MKTKAIRGLLMFLLVGAAAVRAQTLPNGVAAGDVDQTSAVLWARSTVVGPLRFEYSLQPDFVVTVPVEAEVVDPAVPVKVEIPVHEGEQYSYRVTDAEGTAATGTFRTPAANGRHGLRFGVSGDWRGELRPYPSISNLAERDLDFFVALGDTIYADYPSPDLPLPQARTLAEFRIKNAEVYSERFGVNSLAEARASTAWYVSIDDHEVTNDFSGGAAPSSDPRFDPTGDYINETDLFNDALQAFQEYNPIRDEFYGDTGDPRTAGKRKLYRLRRFGDDAAMMMLDARSFRDEPIEEFIGPPGRRAFREYLEASFDESRTMLSAVQLAELLDDLLFAEQNGITWKFVLVPEPIQNLGPILASDRFEGYAYERTRLLDFIVENGIRNVVFITADIHGTVVNDLAYELRPGGRRMPTDLFEITTGAVAFAAPFGPTTIAFAPRWLRTLYERLNRGRQDSLFRIIGNALLGLYGYPRIGLQHSRVEAELLEGSYVAVNSYGWTEFEIDAQTQRLTVTTYGIDWYGEAELLADSDEVLSREPQILSRFRVEPQAWLP